MPSCPPHYRCTFVPDPPPHYWAHWYDGSWGIVVAILAIAALVAIVCTVAYHIKEAHTERLSLAARERADAAKRQHELDMEEQRTMQLDAAKGNTELLKLSRQA